MDAQERARRLAGDYRWPKPSPDPPGRSTAPFRDRIRAGEFASPLLRAWPDQIQRILDDVVDLHASRGVFERPRSVVRANARLQTHNMVFDRIFRRYVTSPLVLRTLIFKTSATSFRSCGRSNTSFPRSSKRGGQDSGVDGLRAEKSE